MVSALLPTLPLRYGQPHDPRVAVSAQRFPAQTILSACRLGHILTGTTPLSATTHRQIRRDQIRKTFLECRTLYAPCLFFWYGMTFLGFCAELSTFTRQAESWVQCYYKILSCTHSWLTFWGVSLAANFVYVEGRKTWVVLQEASLRLPPVDHAAEPTGEFSMLKEDVKEISLAFTIAGFYKLTLKAAFSVFSCMLTYAFVWYQIGPASNREGT
ncbi:hypothetical protein HPB51_018016 [Rhipicephalus microplus]|uniref:Uncharacterized protein n=1 Tax=Rhipicephalus microplus TaxID=6941 RepID=A0A9J6D612_RHIMP|nr:hypothetical protein HPB51_018016 [Rhipicephalus microplus]